MLCFCNIMISDFSIEREQNIALIHLTVVCCETTTQHSDGF